MKKILLLLILFSWQLSSAQNFKVIGYLPTYRFTWLNDIEFNLLTHVNIAFANPDSLGNMSCDGTNIGPAVTKAHQQGCQVFISLAGGYLTPTVEGYWNNLMLPANRAAFIQKIVQFVQLHNLDGVDVDLEWQYVTSLYSPFMIDLKAALAPLGKPLSAALPGSHRYPQITNQALAAMDWVNMMVYDLTGPWDPSNPGQHSPYSWAKQCIQFWKNQNVPAQKLTLGVPFYGYDFSSSPVNAFTYRAIVNQNAANAQLDQNGMKYWNGIPTIKAKTQLALDEVSGIMIWELGEDAFGANAQYSLLRAIDEVVDATTGTSSAQIPALHLFPNPASDWVSLQLPDETASKITVYNLQGSVVLEQMKNGGGMAQLSVVNLPSGMYGVTVHTGEKIMAGKFVKQ